MRRRRKKVTVRGEVKKFFCGMAKEMGRQITGSRSKPRRKKGRRRC